MKDTWTISGILMDREDADSAIYLLTIEAGRMKIIVTKRQYEKIKKLSKGTLLTIEMKERKEYG